jgi:hypothetical protein
MHPQSVTADNWGGIRPGSARQQVPEAMRDPFDRYVQLESQTPDDLRAALWRGGKPDQVNAGERFDPKPLRDRPLLRTSDGRAIIIDLAFFAETTAVGPLFTLAAWLRGRGETEWFFQAFGDAFEDYATGILGRMYPEGALLSRRLVRNPQGRQKDGNNVQIADACLNDVTVAVTFECKAKFVPEGATLNTETYLQALREKYGGTDGEFQLGRWIRDIATGAVTPMDQDWSRVDHVYPVLVTYDERVDRPGHDEFFLGEFTKALEPESVLAGGFMRKGRFTVAPPTVMPIGVLELLESSVNNFRLAGLLHDYTNARRSCGYLSLHDYLAYTAGTKYKLSRSAFADRALKLLEGLRARMFPQMPFPQSS